MFKTAEQTNSRSARSHWGFTIVELLITIGIIFILVSTALYGLSLARRSATRTQTMNALRQMMTGYSAYTEENHGRLMPGYMDQPTMTQLGFLKASDPTYCSVKLKTGHMLAACNGGECDAGSYVWRLAPYLDHAWQTVMADYRSGELDSRFDLEYGDGQTGAYGPGSTTGGTPPQLGISLRPSIGLNSIYLGGDAVHGDPNFSPWALWPGNNPVTGALQQMSKAKNTTRVIVFAPVRAGDSETLKNTMKTGSTLGYPVLTPPYNSYNAGTQTAGPQLWEFDPNVPPGSPDQISFTGMGNLSQCGLPFDRLSDHKITVSHLDGSVEIMLLESLGPNTNNPNTQMSHWSPFALGNN